MYKKDISEESFIEVLKLLQHNTLIIDFSLPQIEIVHHCINYIINNKPKVSESLLEELIALFPWYFGTILMSHKVSENFIRKHIENLDKYELSICYYYQDLSVEFIEEFYNKLAPYINREYAKLMAK